MILKGLQRDNEDKTLEVEALRRKAKIMSDFLARPVRSRWMGRCRICLVWWRCDLGCKGISHGRQSREGAPQRSRSCVAAANATAVSVQPIEPSSRLPWETRNANPFSPAASSPQQRAWVRQQRTTCSSDHRRMQPPLRAPTSFSFPAFSGLRRSSSSDADDSIDEVADALARTRLNSPPPCRRKRRFKARQTHENTLRLA